MVWIGTLVTAVLIAAVTLLRWGCRWGSSPVERRRKMPGDHYLADGPTAHVAMTRAISIDATPEQVWPWLAQLGRGAGWYSFDWLDNGRRASAWHLVSWIPEPMLGDATAMGYLRHLQSGRALAWWVGGVSFAGARARLVCSYVVESAGQGTRLISRMSADATGLTAPLALLVFRVVDSIMASRQLVGIRRRVELLETERGNPRDSETGVRDQYQLFEVLYAAGDSAGVAGKEHAKRWRLAAIADGILRGGNAIPGVNDISEPSD